MDSKYIRILLIIELKCKNKMKSRKYDILAYSI